VRTRLSPRVTLLIFYLCDAKVSLNMNLMHQLCVTKIMYYNRVIVCQRLVLNELEIKIPKGRSSLFHRGMRDPKSFIFSCGQGQMIYFYVCDQPGLT
jgi:hypothetical protein